MLPSVRAMRRTSCTSSWVLISIGRTYTVESVLSLDHTASNRLTLATLCHGHGSSWYESTNWTIKTALLGGRTHGRCLTNERIRNGGLRLPSAVRHQIRDVGRRSPKEEVNAIQGECCMDMMYWLRHLCIVSLNNTGETSQAQNLGTRRPSRNLAGSRPGPSCANGT